MASNANDVSSEVCWFRTRSSVQTSYHSRAVYKNSSFLAQKSKEKVKCLEIVRSLSSYKAGPKRTGKAVSVADVVGTISEPTAAVPTVTSETDAVPVIPRETETVKAAVVSIRPRIGGCCRGSGRDGEYLHQPGRSLKIWKNALNRFKFLV